MKSAENIKLYHVKSNRACMMQRWRKQGRLKSSGAIKLSRFIDSAEYCLWLCNGHWSTQTFLLYSIRNPQHFLETTFENFLLRIFWGIAVEGLNLKYCNRVWTSCCLGIKRNSSEGSQVKLTFCKNWSIKREKECNNKLIVKSINKIEVFSYIKLFTAKSPKVTVHNIFC